MDPLHQTAFETAIAIETRSLSFYRAVTALVKDHKTREIFELLAREEASHLESFCNLYQGSESELVNILGKSYTNIFADPYYCILIHSVNCNTAEKEALRIALEEEQACIDSYTLFVETIREPYVQDLFASMLEETRKHYEIISEEYMRVMKMVDRNDQDTYVRE